MAKGSTTTLAGWEPRRCEDCGRPITHSGKDARGAFYRFDVARSLGRARHADCKWRLQR